MRSRPGQPGRRPVSALATTTSTCPLLVLRRWRDVEIRAVAIDTRNRRLSVPVIDKALRHGYSLEYPVRRPHQVAADRQQTAAPIGVPDPQDREACAFLGTDADVVVRQGRCGGRPRATRD